jgi:hypothetical protein
MFLILLFKLRQFFEKLFLKILHMLLMRSHFLNVCLVPIVSLGLIHSLLDLIHQRRHHLGVGRLLLHMLVDAWRRLRWSIFGWISCGLHQRPQDELVGVGGAPRRFVLVGFEGREKTIDAGHKTIVDDALILEGGDLVTAVLPLLVDLILLGSNEGPLVDVGMDLDVRVVAELEGVLEQLLAGLER